MQRPPKCPWTILGVKKSASAEQIRDAYRKMALKYHPDMNKGCKVSGRLFQEAKEAFEELKEKRRPSNIGNLYQTYRSNSEYARYRYTDTRRRTSTGDQFYGFRRDKAGKGGFKGNYESGYQANEWVRRSADNQAFSSMQRRLRILERTGVGAAVLIFGVALSFAAVGTEAVWKASNKGKSFDDLVRDLDKRDSSKERSGRRRKMTNVMSDIESKPP
ncbi:unnamed protein product [Agarophyton chilense]